MSRGWGWGRPWNSLADATCKCLSALGLKIQTKNPIKIQAESIGFLGNLTDNIENGEVLAGAWQPVVSINGLPSAQVTITCSTEMFYRLYKLILD